MQVRFLDLKTGRLFVDSLQYARSEAPLNQQQIMLGEHQTHLVVMSLATSGHELIRLTDFNPKIHMRPESLDPEAHKALVRGAGA